MQSVPCSIIDTKISEVSLEFLDFFSNFRLYTRMLKLKPFIFSILILLPFQAQALDPVAPKSDRAFGFFKVETPQSSDTCELSRLSPANPPYTGPCKVNSIMTLPVGEYQLNVKIQEYSWSEKIQVLPTEYTSVAVLGYGSLLVTSPHTNDTILVADLQGKTIAQFKTNTVKSIPTGVYNVTVKSKRQQTSVDQVSIVPNKTRELLVTYQ